MKIIRCVIAALLLPIGALAVAAETPNTGASAQQPPPINDKSPSASTHKKHKAHASKNHKKNNPPEPDKSKKKINPPDPDKNKSNPPEPDKASPAK